MKISFDNIRINYDDFGQGPVVIFVPESHYNSQIWNSHVGPLIAAGYRVILLEFIDAPDATDCGSAVIKLLNYLGIGRAAICGMHQDNLMLQLLSNYPQRIACVCQMTALVKGNNAEAIDTTNGGRQVSELKIPYETGGDATRQLIDFLSIFSPHKKRHAAEALASAA
jgi:hypothetical protein